MGKKQKTVAEPLRMCGFSFCLGFPWVVAFNLRDRCLWSAVTDYGWWGHCQSDRMVRKGCTRYILGWKLEKQSIIIGRKYGGPGLERPEHWKALTSLLEPDDVVPEILLAFPPGCQ